MQTFPNATLGRFYVLLPALYILLSIIGFVAVWSSSVDHESLKQGIYIPAGLGKELILLGIGVFVFFLLRRVPYFYWHQIHWIVYLTGLVLLVMVLLAGTEINGARSWFVLPGGFSLQVSEFAKVGLILSLSSFITHYRTDLKKRRSQLVSLMIVLVPVVLILLQPDAGTALVYLMMLMALFFGGLPIIYLIVFAAVFTLFVLTEVFGLPLAVLVSLVATNVLMLLYEQRRKRRQQQLLIFGFILVIGMIFFDVEELIICNIVVSIYLLFFLFRSKQTRRAITSIGVLSMLLLVAFGINLAVEEVLRPHQKERILAWLRPQDTDPLGTSYNITQSKMAISSGGGFGKGMFQGTLTHLDYVPEQSTDFIFSVIGEEQGFVGVLLVLFLYGALLYHLCNLALKFKTQYCRYFTLSVALLLFVHVFINIGMTIGLMPIIGIPLPFISKGGSAFISFSILLGIVYSMQSSRNA